MSFILKKIHKDSDGNYFNGNSQEILTVQIHVSHNVRKKIIQVYAS